MLQIRKSILANQVSSLQEQLAIEEQLFVNLLSSSNSDIISLQSGRKAQRAFTTEEAALKKDVDDLRQSIKDSRLSFEMRRTQQEFSKQLILRTQQRIANRLDESSRKSAISSFLSKLFKTKGELEEEENEKKKRTTAMASELVASAPVKLMVNPLQRKRKRG